MKVSDRTNVIMLAVSKHDYISKVRHIHEVINI